MADDTPAEKMKTITLTKDPSEAEFQVEKITDSIDYTPGEYLGPAEVQKLCDAEDWKVIVLKFRK